MRLQKKVVLSLISLLFIVSIIAGVQNAYANGAGPLVETQWVADNIKDLKLVHVGFVGEEDQKNYNAKHIPGSVYMGMNELMTAMRADNNNPDKAKFEELMGKLGISNDSRVVLFSTPAANPFVPAAYWMMKYFGHADVSIMNGSLDKWNSEGRAATGDAASVSPSKYSASAGNAAILVDGANTLSNHKKAGIVVVDTRGADEYTGEKKVDYIKAAGHIPGATNLNFYPTNRNGDGTYKSAAEIKKAYEAAGVTMDKEIITYCEGGPRAADAYFALKELSGYPNVKVYVGSWMEWGNDNKYPVEN
jgi:thiosulfate/3-mercaptopyruvate sulfurtransferase